MSMRICLGANTLYYPTGGGHHWVFLNWALGLRQLGCEIVWLERALPTTPAAQVQALVATLKARLAHYGLSQDLVLVSWTGDPLSDEATAGCLTPEAAAADLLLNSQYDLSADVVRRYRRSALLDIDPGLLQLWVSGGRFRLTPHDAYFTIGETVGQPGACFPDLGLRWHYTPPCVALPWWPPRPAPADAPFTTVVHWYASGQTSPAEPAQDKRAGFLPFLDVPQRVGVGLELAVDLGSDDNDWVRAERASLLARGWRLRDPRTATATPWDYQRYIQTSRGEFSCAKPSCIRLQNAWLSDRTLCYLASGKPAVVEHTGPSRFLPDRDGLFRFRTPDEAVTCLEAVIADYEIQCRRARALAEAHFAAETVVRRVLERAFA